ncbi:MAG: chemotaxis protein CheA [Panacagrimonas sp.]
MSIDLQRFHQSFFEESFEGVAAMERALLALDLETLDADAINTIFRAAHSIKGGAATFGFGVVAEFTHGVETLLDRMRDGRHAIARADVELLLGAVDVMRALLSACRDGGEVPPDLTLAVQRELDLRLGGGNTRPAAGVVTAAVAESGGWRIRFVPARDLFRSGNDPLRILRELATLGALEAEPELSPFPEWNETDAETCYLAWNLTLRGTSTEIEVREVFAWVEDQCELRIEPLQPPVAVSGPKLVRSTCDARSSPKAERSAVTGEGTTIRVGTSKIDLLINLVGELVITQAMLAQTAEALDPVQHERLLNGLQVLDRNTRQLQEAVMSTRMLPMDSVFSRFPRLVRDLAGKLGKEVTLHTVGEATELDKSVIEQITDPLNHLVRNSLDHGIESPGDRIAAGKAPAGSITLKAAHQGGHIVIEVADDGRGLNRDKILAKATERGLSVSDAMSDAEVWQLIFAPGFSTAEAVTDVSGRGVGMDVVKQNIQSLGGQVDLRSVAGGGTTVSVRLPLTLAILDGMSIAVGAEVFILPLSSVVESLQPLPQQVRRVTQQSHVVQVRNEYLPLIDLRDFLALPGMRRPAHEAIVVIVEAEGRKLALQVDELVGQQQVVIKSLETNYRRVRGVSGATILGDGRVSLIFDVGAMVRLCSQAQAA